MHVLVVTPACHYPSKGAVQQDIYATLLLLRDLGHQVTLYTIDAPGQDHTLFSMIEKEYGATVRWCTVKTDRVSWFRRACREWRLLDRSADAFAALADDPDFRSYVRMSPPHVCIVYCTYGWPVVRTLRAEGIRCVIRSHNVEPFHFWEALEPRQKWYPLSWMRFFVKMAGEKKSVRIADAVAAISPAEQAQYERWRKDAILLVPLVSLYAFLRPARTAEERTPIDVCYLGATYNVVFHRRGAEMLIHQIAPRVLRQAPGRFRFHICGSKLPPRLVRQCDGVSIVHEGYVPDMDIFFSRMDAGIFPVWSGRGMKQKIFETLCRALPIVVPRVSLGGYALEHKKNALIANTPADMAAEVVRLSDPSLRMELSRGAQEFSSAHFSKQQFLTVLNTMIYGRA